MYYNRVELKARARESMRHSAMSPYVTALIYCAVIYIIGLLSARLLNVDVVSVVKHLGADVVMENPEISLFWQEKDMKTTRRSKVRSILWMKES